MPAASSKPTPQNAPQGATDFPSQLMAIMEKKIRNLEKRKGKLQQYRDMVMDGQELTKDQVQAASHFDEVVSNLEFAKELQKTFAVAMTETTKVSKKQAKRENAFKHELELRKIQDIMLLNNILNTLGMDHIRNDFLEGKNGAVKLTNDQVDHLDEFYKLVNPARDSEEQTEVSFEAKLTAASEHLNSYIKEDEKEVLGTTYKALKELINQINSCGYLDNLPAEPVEEVEEVVEETSDPAPSSALVDETPEDDFSAIQQDQAPPPEVPEVTSSVPPAAVIPPTPEEPVMSRVQPVDHSFPKPIEMPPHKVKGHGSDILASVQQGSFNFMQDSMLEYENSPHMDPAVVSVSQSYLPPQGYNSLNHPQAVNDQSMQQRQSLDQHTQPQTIDMSLSDPNHPSQLPTHPGYDAQSGMVSDTGYAMQSPYETQQPNMVQPQSLGHQALGQQGLPGQSLGQTSNLGPQGGLGGQQRGHSTQPGSLGAHQTLDGLSQSQTILSTQHQQMSDLPEFPSPPVDAQHSSAEDKTSSLQASMLGQQSSMSSMGSGSSYSQSLSSQNLSGQNQMSPEPSSQHTSQMVTPSHTEHPSATMQHHSGDMSSSAHPNAQGNNALTQKSTMNASAPPFQMTNSTRSSPQMQAMQQSAIDPSQTEMGTFQSTDSTPQAEKPSERDSGSPKAETATTKSPQGEQSESMEQPSDNQSSNSTAPSSYSPYQSSYSNSYQQRGGNGRGNPRGGRGNINNTNYRGNRGGMPYMGGRGGGRYPPTNPNQSPRGGPGGYSSYIPRDNFQQRAQDMPFGNASQNFNTFNRPQDPNYGYNRRGTTQRGAPRGARGGPGGVRGQSNFRGRGGSTNFKPQSSQLTV